MEATRKLSPFFFCIFGQTGGVDCKKKRPIYPFGFSLTQKSEAISHARGGRRPTLESNRVFSKKGAENCEKMLYLCC